MASERVPSGICRTELWPCRMLGTGMCRSVRRAVLPFVWLALLGLDLRAPFAAGLSCWSVAAAAPAAELSASDLGDNLLVLHRNAAPGMSEGVVIDLERLRDTLQARVLAERGLGDFVQLVPAAAESATSDVLRTTAQGYELTHTFAAPFEGLSVTLQMAQLNEPDTSATLYALLASVAACLAMGLYALYRMAATQVLFAERRSNFVAAVSHELKTPLTAIRMHAEMLQEGLVPDEARRDQYHRTITAESERLTRLIGNVLELSKLERHEAPELTLGKLGPVVSDAVNVLTPHAKQQGFRLTLHLSEPLPPVRYHADGLRQILFNLIENSLKYARDAQTKSVEVSCKLDHDSVVLRVRDYGPGVEPRHLSSLFEPFYRAERELTRRHSGTGIGLALVEGLAKQMGGRTEARNLPEGFEVAVHLPVADRRS